jgi:hypothetical protein
MKLGTIAHSRAGDKGNVVNVSVIAFDERDYPQLSRAVTAERVKAQLGSIVEGEVRRYELPRLGALNFVFARPARDTVTRTLALDAHGKTLSSVVLDLEIEE